MPIYEYLCADQTCQHKFDVLILSRMKIPEDIIVCEKCGSGANRVKFSSTNFNDVTLKFQRERKRI